MERALVSVSTLLLLSGCVSVDPKTGKTLPRGGQRYEFAVVERQAKKLKEGMTKYQVLMLLGSPAETGDDGNLWIYLPERPAVLIPSRALRVVFKLGHMVEYSYRAIILGQPL